MRELSPTILAIRPPKWRTRRYPVNDEEVGMLARALERRGLGAEAIAAACADLLRRLDDEDHGRDMDWEDCLRHEAWTDALWHALA